MRHRIINLDHECPAVVEFYEMLSDDVMGVGVHDDMSEDFQRKHIKTCERCQKHDAENAE